MDSPHFPSPATMVVHHRPHGLQEVKHEKLLRKLKPVLLIGSIALILLAGCIVGPNYKRPATARSACLSRSRRRGGTQGGRTNSLGDRNWATVFREPEFQQLIRTALVNNYDVRIAAEHVLEQQAQVRITRSQRFPTLGVGGTASAPIYPVTSAAAFPPVLSRPGASTFLQPGTPDFWGTLPPAN